MKIRNILLASCGAGMALLVAENAAAQAVAATAEASASEQGTLGEIIVTAQKRSENLQKVPVQVTAVTQENLQRQGVQDFTTLTKVAPEVVTTPGQFVVLAVRGVRPSTFSPTSDSPNAVHVDGAYISRFTSLQGLFFDLERVEVLAGPQGTLYGRNSLGGTVNLITAKPTPDASASGSIEFGNYNQIVAQGAVNLPLNDKLAVRLAYRHYAHDGYFTDTGTDDALQDSVRFSALWKPTERDRVLFTSDLQKVGGKGSAANIVDGQLSPGGAATAPTANVRKPDDVRHNQVLVGNADLQRQDTKGWGFMTQYEHDFDWATLTFQVQKRGTTTYNTTGTVRGWQQTAFNPTAGLVTSKAFWDSEELRLSSATTTPFQWVVGLYRFGETTKLGQNASYASNVSSVILNNIVNPRSTDESYAAFGQVVYTPPGADRLHLTVGGRYNTEKKAGDGYTLQAGAIVFSYPFSKGKWDAATYKVNLAFDVTSRSLIYGGVSSGFKSGGFAYGPKAQYEPEKITAFEIGTKNRFFDNRLQINATAWIYNYKDLVANATQPFNVGVQTFNLLSVLNAANAKNRGQSIDIDWLITRNDTLHVSGQHLSNKFGAFDLSYIPGLFNYSNTPIGYSPEWSANLNYDHVFHGLGGEWDAQLALQYNGDRLLAAQAVVGFPQQIRSGDYTLADVSLRYEPQAGNWSITGYVRNLTDKDYLVNAAYVSNATVPYRYNTGTYGPPRTFGVIFAAKL